MSPAGEWSAVATTAWTLLRIRLCGLDDRVAIVQPLRLWKLSCDHPSMMGCANSRRRRWVQCRGVAQRWLLLWPRETVEPDVLGDPTRKGDVATKPGASSRVIYQSMDRPKRVSSALYHYRSTRGCGKPRFLGMERVGTQGMRSCGRRQMGTPATLVRTTSCPQPRRSIFGRSAGNCRCRHQRQSWPPFDMNRTCIGEIQRTSGVEAQMDAGQASQSAMPFRPIPSTGAKAPPSALVQEPCGKFGPNRA